MSENKNNVYTSPSKLINTTLKRVANYNTLLAQTKTKNQSNL